MEHSRKSCRQQNIPKRTMKSNEGALRPRMAAALLLVLFRRNMGGGKHNPRQLNNQQRGQHRRLGNAHGARDDLVEASCVSSLPCKHESAITTPLLLSPQSPGFAGSPRRASEKRTVGSPGRLHHAAQSVWTHNVWPARKTGCRSWGCKQSRPLPRAVRAAKLCPRCSPSPGCELQIRRKKIIATILATTKGRNPNFKRA